MVKGISLRNSFWVVSTCRVPIRKRLKRSTLNFAHTFLTDCLLHNIVQVFFLIMNYSFFVVIIQRVLKAHFAWKRLRVDYRKIFKKKKITGMVLFVLWDLNGFKNNKYPPCRMAIFLAVPFNKISQFSKSLITFILSFISLFIRVIPEPLINFF